MEVMEAIRTRRSIRAYKPDAVPEEALTTVLEAARLAPSAANRQNWKFVAVRDPKLRPAMMEACRGQKFVGEAPVTIVCCATDPNWKWAAVDVAIATDHMTLAAWSLGLGTCWIGAFDEARVKEVIGAPEAARVICCLTLGYPAAEGVFRGRKSAAEVISFDRY